MLAFFLVLLSPAEARAQLSPGELSKAHARWDGALECLECHGRGESSMDERCLDCHREIRFLRERGRGAHGRPDMDECSRCHPDHGGREFELIRWPGSGPADFDHRGAGWPLRGRHAALECRKCHRAENQEDPVLSLLDRARPGDSWLALETGCADCHRDVHRGALGADCARCHDESGWAPAARFDHATTSYPLTGKHVDVVCRDCHHDAPSEEPAFRPLRHEQCSDCHRDPHQSRLGGRCDSCHATTAWAAVRSADFDHARTRYPLEGKHTVVACRACHEPWGPRPAFDACSRCHQDAHAGQATLAGVPADCDACHDVGGFDRSTYTVSRHDGADFPLRGKHRDVACGKCHVRRPDGGSDAALGPAGVRIRVEHERCNACHENAHGTQVARIGADCEPCHDAGGWRPSRITAARHGELGFDLEGRHRLVDCRACHGPGRTGLPALPGTEEVGTAGVMLVLGKGACDGCHVDVHRGTLAEAAGSEPGDPCASCHDADSFRTSRVDVARHARFAFPLEGAHAAVPCVECHRGLGSRPPASSLVEAAVLPAVLLFRAGHGTCDACHETPHGRQFDGRPGGSGCDVCHGLGSFQAAVRFDHDRDSDFPLRGAHRRLACASCHPRPDDGPAIFRPRPTACEACHGRARWHRSRPSRRALIREMRRR